MRTLLLLFVLASCGPAATPSPSPTPTPTPAPTPTPPPDDAPGNEAPEAPTPIAIVVLFEGHAMWIGNSHYVAEDEGPFYGAYKELTAALDALTAFEVAGSVGAFVSYGEGPEIRHDFIELHLLSGDRIGSQKELAGATHYGHTRRDLVEGLNEAKRILVRRTERRVLMVIGDGVDTDRDRGQAEIAALATELADDAIEVHAIFLEMNELEGDSHGFAPLTTSVQRLSGADGLGPAVEKIMAALAD